MGPSMRQCQKQLENLQKQGRNKWCFECQTANPQWASPKYGIYICLECAGTHRSLGVHISFVRSITMDQFKPEEMKLMEAGGNSRAAEYFKEHGIDETVTIVDKFNSTVAEDYRELLLAEVRGEQWTRRDRPVVIPDTKNTSGSTDTHMSVSDDAFKQKSVHQEPSLNDLASEAMGAISSGWGWFSKTVTKTVTETNDNFIRHGVKQFVESDVGGSARRAVEQFGRKAREAGAYSAEQFNKYAGETMGGEQTSTSSEFAHLFDGWNSRSNEPTAEPKVSAEPKASAEPNDSSTSKNQYKGESLSQEKPKNTFKAGTLAEATDSAKPKSSESLQNSKKND